MNLYNIQGVVLSEPTKQTKIRLYLSEVDSEVFGVKSGQPRSKVCMNDVLEYLLIASLADSIFEHMQHKTTIKKKKQYARVAYLIFHRVQLNASVHYVMSHYNVCVCEVLSLTISMLYIPFEWFISHLHDIYSLFFFHRFF